MARRVALLGALVAAAATAGFLAWSFLPTSPVPRSSLRSAFVAIDLPADHMKELFDFGVADVDGDDRVDLFSSNHNTRQVLWVADERGGYVDMLSAWGLDQDPRLPGVEISDDEPTRSEPGVYVHWEGRNSQSEFPLVIRTHRLKELGRLEGSLETFSSIKGYEGGTFKVSEPVATRQPDSELPRTTMQFATDQDGELRVQVGSPGVPVTLKFGDAIPLASVFVGPQKANPSSREFDIAFQDRHGLAWSDYNEDGLLDVYISRGAIGGTLRKFPPGIQARVKDELLVSRPGARYEDRTVAAGIDKRGCSGRKVSWADFDRDGLLDLFVNCMERGFVAGQYPKQLYRQTPDRRFVDVAAEVGLGLADHEVVDFVWLDVDGDGFPELVTHEDKGFYLYRNLGGRFSPTFVGRGKFARADVPKLKGTADEYWFVDGKLVVANLDGDGDLDVLCASKKGNTLLLNDGKGGLVVADPAGLGLAAESATAGAVDFDNDGLTDLFFVPQGLFRQRSDHTYELTGLLAAPGRKYMAAIANWADLDSDGRQDVVMALLENFSFWSWWEQWSKTTADKWRWSLGAYRNVGGPSHWLQLRLVGKPGNPQAIGARATIRTSRGQQTGVVGLNDGAFFSQGNYRLHFGLGLEKQIDELRILWPDGTAQELRNVTADQLVVVKQTGDRQEGIR